MSKKSFKDNPAMAFLSNSKQTHDTTQQEVQEHTQEQIQDTAYDNTQETALEQAQQDTQNKVCQVLRIETQENMQLNEAIPITNYVRTQGRKGHKKPRINLAFDSDSLLNQIRIQADREGKSITQLMNEAIIIYLNSAKK